MKAILDLDVILYRCGFAAEKSTFKVYLEGAEEEFGPVASFTKRREANEFVEGSKGLYVVKEVTPEPLANCLHSVKAQIQSILEETGATSYIGFLTGKKQFREEVATIRPYKGNRDPTHKPYHYENIKKYLVERWNAQVVDYYEADDAMAMEQWDDYVNGNNDKVWSYDDNGYTSLYLTDPDDWCFPDGTVALKSNSSILCTIDKDLDQIPGWHYNFLHKVKYWVSEEEALRWFYVQLIAGDSTDNIQGVPGYGEKKAMKALDNCKTEQEMYAKTVELYTDYFKDKQIVMDTIKETAKLVYMVKEKGVSWCPPSY